MSFLNRKENKMNRNKQKYIITVIFNDNTSKTFIRYLKGHFKLQNVFEKIYKRYSNDSVYMILAK